MNKDICYNAYMDFSSLKLLPDPDVPDNSKRIKFLRLKRFEQDLLDSGISFVYSDDTTLEGGLIAGGSPALYKEYALEVYRLCTDGLSLTNQKKYDELLEIIQESKVKPFAYHREYHYSGNEEGIKEQKWFKAIAVFLLDYAFFANEEIVSHRCFCQLVRYWNKDNFQLCLAAFYSQTTGSLLIEEELLFYLLLKIDELMADCDFYLK